MNAYKMTRQMALGCVAAALSCSAFAVTATPESLSIAAGSSQTVQLSNISGTLSVYSSSSAVAKVSRVDDTTYQINGVKAGSAEIKFRDRKSYAKVKVMVTATAVSTAGAATPLNGRLLASNCFQCHGTNGTGGFDQLAGKSYSEIYGDLQEFASGKEDADGIMAAHAMGFTDEQLKAIASYFSSIR